MAKSSSNLVVRDARDVLFIAPNHNRLYVVYNSGGM